ncbi:signal peptidase I [Patescibacteria group bacterium]|nr:signal peptidase I [Patescibacteria group bacterium]MCL5092023.1 signal peptidase I [Patescibacteria group bacterium]
MKKHPLKLLFELATWIVIAIFALLAVFTIMSNTSAFAGYQSYLVQSGSMEPAIMTGDIIVVHAQPEYHKNDTITFRGSDGRIVTHRIAAINEKDGRRYFTTKGDANRSEDNDNVISDQVIGTVALVIPRLGYLVAFSRTIPGLFLLILIPTVTIILDELLRLING